MTDRASAGAEASAIFEGISQILTRQSSSISSGALPPDFLSSSPINTSCVSYASVNTESGASFSIGWAIEAGNLAEALSRETDIILSTKAEIVLREVAELSSEAEYYSDMQGKIKGMI